MHRDRLTAQQQNVDVPIGQFGAPEPVDHQREQAVGQRSALVDVVGGGDEGVDEAHEVLGVHVATGGALGLCPIEQLGADRPHVFADRLVAVRAVAVDGDVEEIDDHGPGEPLACRGVREVGMQPRCERVERVGGVEQFVAQCGDAVDAVAEHRLEQRLPCREVPVERSDSHAGALRDVIERRVRAALLEGLPCRGEQAVAVPDGVGSQTALGRCSDRRRVRLPDGFDRVHVISWRNSLHNRSHPPYSSGGLVRFHLSIAIHHPRSPPRRSS